MKKKYSHLIICVIIILLLFVSPPVMFVKGIPVLGKSTEKFKGSMEHYADYDNNFPNNRQYYAADFEHFYFVNLRFWERIEIEQLEYYQQEAGDVKRIVPGIYSVTHMNGDTSLCSFEVERGNKKWYFDYLAKPYAMGN